MLWPNDKQKQEQWAQVHRMLNYVGAIPKTPSLLDNRLDLTSRDFLELLHRMEIGITLLPHARRRYRECLQAGKILGAYVHSNGEAGFGLRFIDRKQHGASMSLKEAKLSFAFLKIKQQRRCTDAEGLDVVNRRWTVYRPICHLAAAHLTYRMVHPAILPVFGSFPATHPNLKWLLAQAEIIRRAAVRLNMPNAQELMVPSAAVIEKLKNYPDDDFAPPLLPNGADYRPLEVSAMLS